MDYAWTITRDCTDPRMQRNEGIAPPDIAGCSSVSVSHADGVPRMNVVGVIGPIESTYWRSACTNALHGHEAILHDPSRRLFQIFDSHVIRYEGYMVFNDDTDATGMEPLMEFGKPYAGCTRIRYRNIDGEWQWL